MNINVPPSASLRNKRNHSQISMALQSSSNPTSSSTSLINGVNSESSGEGSMIESRGSSAPPLRASGLGGVNVAVGGDEEIKFGELGLMGEEDDRPAKVRRMNGNGVGSSNGNGNGNEYGNWNGNGDDHENVHEEDDLIFDAAPNGVNNPQSGRENSEEFVFLPMDFDVDMIPKVDGDVVAKEVEMNLEDQSIDGHGEHRSMETPTEGGEPLHEELASELTCGMCAGLFVEPLTLTPCGHAFCGSCIALWLKSFQPNYLLTYTNPTPALQHQLALARDREMYGDGPPSNGVTALANGAIDAASVNGILGGGIGGVHPTPIEGLSCPQCRLRPVVDAAPNMVLKSLIEVLTKHHPDMARTAEEIAQMQATYKRGDLLSFPQPPRALSAGGAAALRSRDRLTGISYWGPCPYCRPLQEGEVSTEDGGSRYVCPLPIPDPNNPAQADRALRSDGMVPDGHRMCSVCQQICPEALAQSCGICGDGCCGSRTRCQLPKLEEAVLSDSSFQVLDSMRGWIKDEAWSRWQDYLSVFQYNFVELAYFLAYVQAQYVRAHAVPAAAPPLRVVDVGIAVEIEEVMVPEAPPTPTFAVSENPVAAEPLAIEPASGGKPGEASVADEQQANKPPAMQIPAEQPVATQASVDEQPVVELPVLEESAVEQPADDPAIGEETAASLAVEEPAIDRVAFQQFLAAEPFVEEQLAVDPPAAPEQLADQRPAVDVPAAQTPADAAPAVPLAASTSGSKKPISTAYICQSIAQWLMSDEGFSSGGLDGMCQRADKEGLVRSDSVPERLCTTCSNSVFCAGMFEWWMREIKEDVQETLPQSIKDREPCKNGRACPYQSNIEHARIYSHLSEKVSPELMESMAHQIAPVATDQVEDDFIILRNAVKDARELFGLPRDPPVPVQRQQPLSPLDDHRQEDDHSEVLDEDDEDGEDGEDDEEDEEDEGDGDEGNNSQQSLAYADIGVQTDAQPSQPIQPVEETPNRAATEQMINAAAATVLLPDDGHMSNLPILSAPSSPVLEAIKKSHSTGNGNDRAITPIPDVLTAVEA